ncbi:MAG: tetratricopeptide repeat protein [Planctomycetaceae bacterium]|nr:tetratricopeptide repeat protein [Planctomycetaceae bacterium]
MPEKNSTFRRRRLETARGYLILGMPRNALKELRRIQHPELCGYDSLLLQAEALRDLCQFEEAIPYFEKTLELNPANLQAHLGLAWCFKRVNRLTKAISALERAREYHPEEPIVIYNLACYFSLLGDKPKAIECLGRSLRMEPQLRELISEEEDFDQLRTDPDFQFVTQTVKQIGD